MADNRLFTRPNLDRSGPAALGREPIVLPDVRRKAVNRVKNALD